MDHGAGHRLRRTRSSAAACSVDCEREAPGHCGNSQRMIFATAQSDVPVADVEFLPDAPVRAVKGTYPQIVRSRTALERGARELGRRQVDRLVGTLCHST